MTWIAREVMGKGGCEEGANGKRVGRKGIGEKGADDPFRHLCLGLHAFGEP